MIIMRALYFHIKGGLVLVGECTYRMSFPRDISKEGRLSNTPEGGVGLSSLTGGGSTLPSSCIDAVLA